MNVVTFRLVKKPVVPKKITLADMPEGVACVCSKSGYVRSISRRCGKVREYQQHEGTWSETGYAKDWEVHQRLDGQPLPCSCQPKSLFDGGEEGRLYEVEGISTLRFRVGDQVYGPDNLGVMQKTGSRNSDLYIIRKATDWVVERVETCLC